MMMTRINKIGWWMLMFLVSAAWLTRAEAAPQDFNQLLRGDYAFSGEATCLVSPGGFNPNLTPLGPTAPFPHVISLSIQGVRTFNGDGTGSAVARVVSISHPFALPTSPTPVFNRGGVNTANLESTFTYEVAPDLTFTVETQTLDLTFDRGTRAGQTSTITDLPRFFGRISQDHKTLTIAHDLADGEQAVETHRFSNGDVDYRICHRSRILLEQKGGR